MSPQAGALMICAILTCITHSQGMLFALDTTPESITCGRLQCLANTIYTDRNVFSVSGLIIYDVTKSSSPVKLASLSVYDPALVQPGLNITATGDISWYNAELTLGLRDHKHCHNSSFLCDLNFVDFDGLPKVMQQTISSGSSGNCLAVFNQFSQAAMQVKIRSDELETENAELKQENAELKQQNAALKTQLDNLSYNEQCVRGMPHNNSRQQFLLWGKIAALCDTETDGGGWIVIQRRRKGNVDFYRGWADYKNGFGTLDTDFWIGNDNIHNLTSQGWTELLVDMEYNGRQYFAHYSYFHVTDEISNYRLSVSGYNGTAGDSLYYHDGSDFSTYDRDNDKWRSSCAFDYHGAWWYNACFHSNLNGAWGSPTYFWSTISTTASLPYSYTEMKVRNL